MFPPFVEIMWILFMVGAVVAFIVATMREKKARAAAAKLMQPDMSMMEMGTEGEVMEGFGEEEAGQVEFNMDSFK